MRLATLALAALLALGATSSFAAELRGDAVYLCDRARQPSDALKPSALLLALSPDIGSGKFDTAYARLADILDASLRPGDRAMPGVAQFLANLRNAQSFGFALFRITTTLQNQELLFRTHRDQIAIDCNASVPQYLVELSSASLIAAHLRAKEALPLLAERAVAVTRASHDAEKLLKDGLPMWPWEMWANGLRLSPRDSDPLFRTQLVLMRPTAGIEVDTRNRASADLNASLILEPVGFVRYRGGDYSHWWGASFVVTSSTGRGAGVGGLLRWDNYVLGLTRHKGDAGRPDSTFLMVGVELYDLINRKRAEVKDWEPLRELRESRTKDLLGTLLAP